MSAGELLREERASGSKDGDLIESCMTDGMIVPVKITISLIEKVCVCILHLMFNSRCILTNNMHQKFVKG